MWAIYLLYMELLVKINFHVKNFHHFVRGEKFLTTKFRKLQYKEMHLQKVYAYFKY